MTVEVSRKDYNIELFRKNGFLCFPIPRYTDGKDHKAGGRNWQNTDPNIIIKQDENYGLKPILGAGTAIADLDDKERYRKYAESFIEAGYMVIETGKGWHIPVIGLTGNISKMELHDYNVQTDKIIEIQGPKHYTVGAGSFIFHKELQHDVTYTNVGSDKIYDAKGQDFNDFVDELCKKCHVTGKKKEHGGSYSYLRKQFKKGEIPHKKQSNDYFFQAALVCNTEGVSLDQAKERIQKIYDEWSVSEYYSDRPWGNIEAKIDDVYENNRTVKLGRPERTDVDGVDRTKITKLMLEEREFYSNTKTHEIFENKNGFLELINDTLKRELYNNNPEIEKADQDSILFKLESGAKEMPITNKDEIVFANGKFNVNTGKISESDDIADMGFKDYNYLPKTEENNPTEFLKLFENIKEPERLRAALRSIFNGNWDSRISVIHGISRVGKSTIPNILVQILKDYAYSVPLDLFLNDRATQAECAGKRLVVFQDLPDEWNEFSKIKIVTGEQWLNIRKFNQPPHTIENKAKYFATSNHLPEIKESEKNAMYTARLSLIHNTRTEAYPEDPRFADRIAKEEGEKIVSWIINLTDKECEYEDSATIKAEWEAISTPEREYLMANWKPTTFESKMLLIDLVNQSGLNIDMDRMGLTMKSLGYNVVNNLIKNIQAKQ